MMKLILLPPPQHRLLLLTGLSVLLLVLSNSLASGSSADDEREMANYVKALRKELFQRRLYDPTISPYIFYPGDFMSINVSLGLDLFYIVDLDTSTSILETTFVLRLGWINENLTWVPDRWGGLELLHLAAGELFRPDIYVTNALVEENLVSTSTHSDVFLSSEGEIFWAPMITLRTLCPLDLTDWPSDRQTCLLRFVSGSFFTTEVLLFNSSNQIETGSLKANPQWTVAATGVHFRSEYYYDLVFELTLQRRAGVFAWAISVPLYAALCLNLGTFLFPGPYTSSSSSLVDFRFNLVRLAFLTLILLSLYVASKLGGVVGVLGMPTLVAFIGRNTVLVTVNLLWSAFLRSSSSSSSGETPSPTEELVSRVLRPLERLLGGEGGGGGRVGDSARLVEEVDELPVHSNDLPQGREDDLDSTKMMKSPSRVVHLLDKLLGVVSLVGLLFR